MEITKKYHKTNTICNWKKRGLVYDDIDDLYYIYINTMNCTHCGKEFPNIKDRCLDHDHQTGLFRNIVCRRCNTSDNYIRFPDGIPPLKERYNMNKDKYYAKEREKITCECGCIISKSIKPRHLKTKKHARLMEQLD